VPEGWRFRFLGSGFGRESSSVNRAPHPTTLMKINTDAGRRLRFRRLKTSAGLAKGGGGGAANAAAHQRSARRDKHPWWEAASGAYPTDSGLLDKAGMVGQRYSPHPWKRIKRTRRRATCTGGGGEGYGRALGGTNGARSDRGNTLRLERGLRQNRDRPRPAGTADQPVETGRRSPEAAMR